MSGFKWRGLSIVETKAGLFEGGNKAAQVRITQEGNGDWTAVVHFRGMQWTGNGKAPRSVLEKINPSIVDARDFLLSDGAVGDS